MPAPFNTIGGVGSALAGILGHVGEGYQNALATQFQRATQQRQLDIDQQRAEYGYAGKLGAAQLAAQSREDAADKRYAGVRYTTDGKFASTNDALFAKAVADNPTWTAAQAQSYRAMLAQNQPAGESPMQSPGGSVPPPQVLGSVAPDRSGAFAGGSVLPPGSVTPDGYVIPAPRPVAPGEPSGMAMSPYGRPTLGAAPAPTTGPVASPLTMAKASPQQMSGAGLPTPLPPGSEAYTGTDFTPTNEQPLMGDSLGAQKVAATAALDKSRGGYYDASAGYKNAQTSQYVPLTQARMALDKALAGAAGTNASSLSGYRSGMLGIEQERAATGQMDASTRQEAVGIAGQRLGWDQTKFNRASDIAQKDKDFSAALGMYSSALKAASNPMLDDPVQKQSAQRDMNTAQQYIESRLGVSGNNGQGAVPPPKPPAPPVKSSAPGPPSGFVLVPNGKGAYVNPATKMYWYNGAEYSLKH